MSRANSAPELRMRANILLNEKTIFEQVTVHLTEILEQESGLKSWIGNFARRLEPEINLEAEYRMELADGRAGDIFFSNITSPIKGLYFLAFRVRHDLK